MSLQFKQNWSQIFLYKPQRDLLNVTVCFLTLLCDFQGYEKLKSLKKTNNQTPKQISFLFLFFQGSVIALFPPRTVKMWQALCKPALPTPRCHHLGGNATFAILLLLNRQSLEVHSCTEASLQNTEKPVVYNPSIASVYLYAKGADIHNWFSSVTTNATVYSNGERYFSKL